MVVFCRVVCKVNSSHAKYDRSCCSTTLVLVSSVAHSPAQTVFVGMRDS